MNYVKAGRNLNHVPKRCFIPEDTDGQTECDMSKFTQLLRSMVGTCLQGPDALATGFSWARWPIWNTKPKCIIPNTIRSLPAPLLPRLHDLLTFQIFHLLNYGCKEGNFKTYVFIFNFNLYWTSYSESGIGHRKHRWIRQPIIASRMVQQHQSLPLSCGPIVGEHLGQ